MEKELQGLLNDIGYWVGKDKGINKMHYLVTKKDHTYFYRCLDVSSVKSLYKALQEKIRMEKEGFVSRVKTMDGGYTWYAYSFQKGNGNEQV